MNLTGQFSLFWGGQRSKKLREIDREDNNLTVNGALFVNSIHFGVQISSKIMVFYGENGADWLSHVLGGVVESKKLEILIQKLREIGGGKVLT